jgi:LmbE family N-acetylglucosaminyl deacetylase
MHRFSQRRLLFRFAFALCSLAIAICGQFLYGIHTGNAAMQGVLLPAHPAPTAGSSILVVAPHCDDETLGAGGLIRDAVRRGCPVTVAFVTNGDGFPMAVSRQYRRLRPRPEDYRRMALQRQEEARAALSRLGVPRDHIFFLGYPDGGIAELWNRYWTSDDPYRSRFTGCTTSPYGGSFRPGAVYCGHDLMLDLEVLLRHVRPDRLYLPHPGDDHPDHWATHCFAQAALEELSDEPGPFNPAWERPAGTQVFTYLVHRGDWPVPQGLHPQARLVPPAPLARLDTAWTTLDLDREAVEQKAAALRCYRSQTAVMNRFLTSFVRRDELFGSLAPEALGLGGRGRARWRTAITDSTRDTLLRGLEGSGDIVAVEAGLIGRRLRLRVITRRPLSPRLTYTVRLHPLGRGADRAEPLTVPFQRLRCQEPVALGDAGGSELEVSVPLAVLGNPSALMVGADSRFGRVPIDRVSWRLLRISPPAPAGTTGA